MEKTNAEQFLSYFTGVIDDIVKVAGANMVTTNGITIITFPDGSIVDFTEPMAFTRK